MSSPKTILSDIGPDSWESPGGGHRRSAQILEILGQAGIQVASASSSYRVSNLRKYCLGARFLLRSGRGGGGRWRRIRRHGGVVARLAPVLQQHSGAKILLWQVTHPNDLVVPRLARRAGFSVIALPQNLEALVPSIPPLSRPQIAARFKAELEALAEVETVVCISREEQWLLALHQIAADYLPYYPPQTTRDFLLRIRNERRARTPGRLLILGSAGNPPTATGMAALIRLLQSLPGGAGLPVDIAGYDTAQLEPHVTNCEYQLHGAVGQDQLGQLLLNARCFLGYQLAAVGALTRVPEMLCAGIPVLANPIAARSFIGLPGVHLFESATDLTELLGNTLPPAEPPARPVGAERRFIEAVNTLLDRPDARPSHP